MNFSLPVDRLLTPKDLAAYLQVSKAAISQWVKAGSIPYLRIGGKSIRFEPLVVLEWLRNQAKAQNQR
jgi:excisionase family DNA binding protein